MCRGGSFECCEVVVGAFYEGLEVGRGLSGEPSCVEVQVPSVVYNKDCVCGVGLWELSMFGGSWEE